MFLSGSLAACGRQTEQSAYHIEYLNKDKNRLVEEPYEPSATDTDGMIKEFRIRTMWITGSRFQMMWKSQIIHWTVCF